MPHPFEGMQKKNQPHHLKEAIQSYLRTSIFAILQFDGARSVFIFWTFFGTFFDTFFGTFFGHFLRHFLDIFLDIFWTFFGSKSDPKSGSKSGTKNRPEIQNKLVFLRKRKNEVLKNGQKVVQKVVQKVIQKMSKK